MNIEIENLDLPEKNTFKYLNNYIMEVFRKAFCQDCIIYTHNQK